MGGLGQQKVTRLDFSLPPVQASFIPQLNFSPSRPELLLILFSRRFSSSSLSRKVTPLHVDWVGRLRGGREGPRCAEKCEETCGENVKLVRPFQTLARTAALVVVASVSVASAAALTLKPREQVRRARGPFLCGGKQSEAHLVTPERQTYVLTLRKLNHTYCRQTRNTPPSSGPKWMAITFLLCTAPSSGTLRERGVSPQPLRQPITGWQSVSPAP